MDINILFLDGVLFVKSISKFFKKLYIVFIIVYKEYVVEVFEIEVFDYILKFYLEFRIVFMLKKLENINNDKENNLYKINI